MEKKKGTRRISDEATKNLERISDEGLARAFDLASEHEAAIQEWLGCILAEVARREEQRTQQ